MIRLSLVPLTLASSSVEAVIPVVVSLSSVVVVLLLVSLPDVINCSTKESSTLNGVG